LALTERPGLDARVSAGLLEALVRYASVLSDKVYMEVTRDGVVSCVADQYHVSIVETEIPDNAFAHYRPVPGWVGFDAPPVRRFLATIISRTATGNALDTDPFRNQLSPAEDDTVVWRMDDELSLTALGRNLSMPMLDMTSPLKQLLTPVARNWPLVVEARVRAESLKQAVEHCESLSKAVVIEPDSYGFMITSKVGSDFKYSLRAGMRWKGDHFPARSAFDLAFVSRMVKEIPDGLEVTVGLGNNYPLLMEWYIGKYVKTCFAVSPLVDKQDL
jgi:hypothetical protein